jgi:hypothetical protein
MIFLKHVKEWSLPHHDEKAGSLPSSLDKAIDDPEGNCLQRDQTSHNPLNR